jgi:hypothetical protein
MKLARRRAATSTEVLSFVGFEVEGKHRGLWTLFVQGVAPSHYVFSTISDSLPKSRSARKVFYANKILVPKVFSGVKAEYSCANSLNSSEASQDPCFTELEQVYFGATYRGRNCSKSNVLAAWDIGHQFPNTVVTYDYDGESMVPVNYALGLKNFELMISLQRNVSATVISNLAQMIALGMESKVQVKFRGDRVLVLPLSAAILNQRTEILKDVLL